MYKSGVIYWDVDGLFCLVVFEFNYDFFYFKESDVYFFDFFEIYDIVVVVVILFIFIVCC